MSRTRPPEDRLPTDAPCFLEDGAVRWQLPVRWQGTTGVLVIRCFDEDVPPYRRKDEGASVRGRLVLLLDAERRNRR